MRELTVNLQLDEDRDLLIVQRPDGQPSGFFNAFNIVLSGKQAEKVDEFLNMKSWEVVAFPDGRFNSEYRIELNLDEHGV